MNVKWILTTIFAFILAQVVLAEDNYRFITNYPNPFDSRLEATTIIYSITQEAEVKIKIYDLLGNLVREYPSINEKPGIKQIYWDGTNEFGEKVAKGGYICVITSCNSFDRSFSFRKIGVIH